MTEEPGLRRHDRTPLTLSGHYTLADGVAAPCETVNLSEGGVALAAAEGRAAGERVTLHLEKIGELDGEIVRSFDGGFAIALSMSPERRREVAATVRAIYENSALGLIETPLLPDGEVDLAMVAEAMTFDAAMMRGDMRIDGETSARVTRNADGGTELEFLARPSRSS